MPFLPVLFLTSTIDLENRVARLPAVVEELANESRLDLAVSKELVNELVYVKSKPRDAEAWMRLLAEATCTEWEQDGKTLRLVRLPGTKRRLEAEELAERTDMYVEGARKGVGAPLLSPLTEADARQAIDTATAARTAAQSPAKGQWERVVAAQEDLLPAQRFMRRYLTRPVLAQIATIPVGEVGYLSSGNHPGRLRTRIDPSLFDLYNRERALLVQTIKANLGTRTFKRAVADISDYLNLTERPAAPVVAANVRVDRYSPNVLVVGVSLLDAQGVVVEQFARTLPRTVDKPSWPRVDPARPFGPTPEIAAMLASFKPEDDARAFRGRAVDPVRHEPGDLFARPVLDSLCERTDTEAVLGLSDCAIPSILNALDEKANLITAARDLEAEVVWRSEANLIVGRPRYPIEATRTRLDRTALRDLLLRVDQGLDARLDTFADYAARQNRDVGVNHLERLIFASTQTMSFGNELVELLLGDYTGSREMLRFYGQLLPDQRQTLWSGQPIFVTRMPAAAQQSLFHRVFRRDVYFDTAPESPLLPNCDAPDLLPKGIPSDAYVQGQTETVTSVIFADGKRRGATMDLERMAFILFRQTTDGAEDASPYSDVRKSRYRPVRKGSLNLKFRFSPAASVTANLPDFEPLSSSPVTFTGLPADYRKAVEEKAEIFRKDWEKQRERQNSQPKTPPPS